MGNINYVRVLTEEEARKSQEEVDKFLLSLDYNTKYQLQSLVKHFQSKIECEHEWIDPNTYENKLPKDKLFCRFCQATKLTKEAKEKLHQEWVKEQEELMKRYDETLTLSSSSGMYNLESEEDEESNKD